MTESNHYEITQDWQGNTIPNDKATSIGDLERIGRYSASETSQIGPLLLRKRKASTSGVGPIAERTSQTCCQSSQSENVEPGKSPTVVVCLPSSSVGQRMGNLHTTWFRFSRADQNGSHSNGNRVNHVQVEHVEGRHILS